ncbi:hypothetical protein M2102_000511 [Fusobacterium sp. PH5-7]|uniref:hypothetical protein n=1 Tax=Fusobacterium sp. PH5-7 TaxID=2940528 RepID=UPI002474D125|nr:hypothetical protein [Fusobacterium sp. PH5-7]MDH6456896.1 hypothetical protein [Fusobacterium sp. PH5-7]
MCNITYYYYFKQANIQISNNEPIERISVKEYRCLVDGVYYIIANFESNDAMVEIRINDIPICALDGDAYENVTPFMIWPIKIDDVISITGMIETNINISFLKISD